MPVSPSLSLHAQVIDNENAPPGVKKEKPPKGKPVALVQFFPTGDLCVPSFLPLSLLPLSDPVRPPSISSWTSSKDMSALRPHEIDAYLSAPHKKSGDLLGAYKIAQNPSAWNAARAQEAAFFEESQKHLEEDELASEGESAQVAVSDGKKRKRKSEGAEGKSKDKNEQKAKKAKLEKLAKSRVSRRLLSFVADREPLEAATERFQEQLADMDLVMPTQTAGGSSKKAAAGVEHSEDEIEPSAKKSKSAADGELLSRDGVAVSDTCSRYRGRWPQDGSRLAPQASEDLPRQGCPSCCREFFRRRFRIRKI